MGDEKHPKHGKMVISDPDNGFLGPDAETRVPCPVCKKTLVSPSIAAIVKEKVGDALKDLEGLPCLHTDIRPILPDQE